MTVSQRPSPAERARTLASGAVTGALHLPGNGGGAAHRVQPLATRDGAQALLVADGGALRRGLDDLPERGADPDLDEPIVLDVLDVPPGLRCLPRARLCVSGWAQNVPLSSQRAIGDRLAAARPDDSLLGIGFGWTLFRFEIGEIQVTTGDVRFA